MTARSETDRLKAAERIDEATAITFTVSAAATFLWAMATKAFRLTEDESDLMFHDIQDAVNKYAPKQ